MRRTTAALTVLAVGLFSAAGTYDYICGLHPAMKGQVEVK